MNPEATSFEDCDLTIFFQIVDKETQTDASFICESDDSDSSVRSNKLPLPRDLDSNDDSIKVYSFCQILQDPECPRSITLIKDSITEEIRNHSTSKDDAVANRYKYCREVIKPFLKDYPHDCEESDEQLVQDAISSASKDFPDYQPCFEFLPTNKAITGTPHSSDNEKRTSLGLLESRGSEKPIVTRPKPKTSNKGCNTEVTPNSSTDKTKVDKSTLWSPIPSSEDMDRQKECPSKTSATKSCSGCPGIPVRDCGPAKNCTSKDCPTKGNPNKSCPLRDSPPKTTCPLKGCPPDICPPKTCEPEACPPEHCPDNSGPPGECPAADTPPARVPSDCSAMDSKKKTKPIAEGIFNSNKDSGSKAKRNPPVETKNDDKKYIVRAEKYKDDVCDGKSSSDSLIDMKKMMQAHNETIATLKIAMEDFMGKVYKTTQEAVATITNESSKQIEKIRKCESSNTDKVGEHKSAETITSFNFVREVESKDKTDKGTSIIDDNVVNQIIRKVESTITVVSERVAEKMPKKLKPTHKFSDTSSPYDKPDSPRSVSNEMIHDPTPVISNNVFTTIKSKICSIFCDPDGKNEKSMSKKSSCSSSTSNKDDDDKLIERFIE